MISNACSNLAWLFSPFPTSVAACRSSSRLLLPRCPGHSLRILAGSSALPWPCHLQQPGRSCCPRQALPRLPTVPPLLPPLRVSPQPWVWLALGFAPCGPGRRCRSARGRSPAVLRERRESAGPRGWVSSCALCQGHCIGSGCEPAAKWSKRSADKGLFFISY